MQSTQTPTLIPLAFAANGTKNTIAEASQIGIANGAASLNDGFPPLTMTPIAAGGVPPSGADMNGILYLVSAPIRWQQAGGLYAFSSSFAGDANVVGYPAGAELMSADLQGSWISTNDNNTDNPDTGPGTKWVPGRAYGVTAIAGLTNANVTLTPAQAAKSKITLAGTLTSNIQIILPAWTRDWTIVNNTSGAFTVTVKTAAGTGVSLAAGQQKVTGDGTNIVQPAESVATATLNSHAAQYGQVLPRIGGTLTGSLNFNGANGSQNLLQWEIGGLPRWALTTDASSETGGNAGTNLLLAVYNDAGAYLGSGWTINRASQVVNFTQTPTSVTAAQFDNSANLATTAFAKAAGFRHAASVQLSASTTLNATHAGKVVVLAGTGGYTITLPNRTNYPDGESVTLVCTASSPITVQRQGTDSIYPNNAPITSFTMANGDTAVIESSSAVTGWNVLGGSVQLGYAGVFGSSLSGSGYQKLPSGLILQWGTGTGGTALSFPLAFPSGLYGITVQIADASVAETGYTSASVTGFTPKTYNTSGGAITAAVFWMAIGK